MRGVKSSAGAGGGTGRVAGAGAGAGAGGARPVPSGGSRAAAADSEDDATKQARRAIGVLVKGGEAPLPVSDLKDLRFPKSFRSVFEFARIETPTAVQQQCWPAVLFGANVRLWLLAFGSVEHISSRSIFSRSHNCIVFC